MNKYDGKVDRIILMDKPKDDGKTMQARIYLYTNGKTIAEEKKEETATVPDGGAATMELFKNVPADVYAIRTYDRNLNDAEIMQNHFVDLCAYAGVDVSKLVALDDAMRATVLATLSKTFADRTFSTANKDEIETAIDAAIDGAKAAIEARKKTELYQQIVAAHETRILPPPSYPHPEEATPASASPDTH
jgi:hypothetical protein